MARDRMPPSERSGAKLRTVDAATLVGEVFAPVAVSGDLSTVVERRPRRAHGHPHPTPGDFYRVEGSTLPTLQKMTAEVEDRGTQQHRDALERNLALLPPEARRSEDEIYDELVEQGEKPMSAAAQAHRELAAVMLAVGATNVEAADHAGVTEATVKGFLSEEPFRAMVAELRGHVVGRIAGRIVNRLDTLTDAEHIEKLDVDDLLHIHDRVAGPKSQAGVAARGTTVNVQVLNYNDLLASLAGPDADDEGEGFETYGPGVIPTPGGRAFRTGEVPGPRLGPPRR